MRRHPVGFRYATALFEYAQERNILDHITQELNDVSQVMQDTKLLDEVFKNAKITPDEKKKIITYSFTDKISEAVLNLLLILVDKKREDIFFAVVEDFKNLTNEARGVAEAEVYSAKALSDAEKEAIAAVFAIKAGKNRLLVSNIVDKELIGGLKVRIGDRVFDGSVASKLAHIQKRMVYGNVSR